MSRRLIVAASACLRGGQELLCPARKNLQQQPMEAVDGLCPCATEFIATVDEHAHHNQFGIDLNLDQAVRYADRRPAVSISV
jgi:hypothetical protein